MLNAGRRVTRAMIIEHVCSGIKRQVPNVIDVYVNFGLRVTEVMTGPQVST